MYFWLVKGIGAIAIMLMLVACAELPTPVTGLYSPTTNSRLYKEANWQLEGRLSIAGLKDSWTANLLWQHLPDEENIKLFGPLGQGAVSIQLWADRVKIDRGAGRVQTSDDPEQFIKQQVGLAVPLHSLRYWAIGLPEPDADYQTTADGFVQFGWLVAYKAMQAKGVEMLPQKMSVSNSDIKLKLIVDQWSLNAQRTN